MCVGGTYFLKSVVRRNHMVILWLKGCHTLAGKAQGNRRTHELRALAPSGLHRQEKVQRSLSSYWSNSSPLSCLYRPQMAKLLFMTELCTYQSELLVTVSVRKKDTQTTWFSSSNTMCCCGYLAKAYGRLVNSRTEGEKLERKRKKTNTVAPIMGFLCMLFYWAKRGRKEVVIMMR